MSEEHETGPIPPGDYTITPISIMSNWMVQFKITEGEYKGRTIFAGIQQLFPRGIRATISIDTAHNDTVKNHLRIHHAKE